MKSAKPQTVLTREELLRILTRIDELLAGQQKKISVTAIGGVSVILLDIRDRATTDIDIINVGDAKGFQEVCAMQGIEVEIVTVASTVDFMHAPKVLLFQGNALEVSSVTAEDLIKLKLERFYKQDPEDIYAIIQKTDLPYKLKSTEF